MIELLTNSFTPTELALIKFVAVALLITIAWIKYYDWKAWQFSKRLKRRRSHETSK